MNTVYLLSPVGLLKIEGDDSCISSVQIVSKKDKAESPNELLKKAVTQLEEYFSGKRKNFDLPLKQAGTDFQQKAWKYLLTIPYGTTVSYKDEATAIGNPKAFRAVGSANGANDIPIIIPCHRVVNSNNKLGGYAYGIEVKEKLLELEKKHSQK
ncbi:MAG: methylated-DNA--[protein]-cysteine S-methyltransferase [Dysgonomonas sp.]